MTSLPNQSLFLSEEFSDVTFIVDNESIPVHKVILAANCPYFKTMLFGATNESKMSSIELNNVSYKAFVEVLRCVYLRKVDISEWTSEEVKNLVQKADEYQFPDMGSVIAESLNIDTQVTIDIIEDVVGVAKRLNCNGLMEKCAESARKQTELLFSDCEAFDKIPVDFIVYLIEKKVWNSADTRLVYSIGNWRKTAPIEDKKVLLSKIDWKSLPGKYSEPLVRMFLENDLEGLQVKDWTNGLKLSGSNLDLIAGVYVSSKATFYKQKHEFEKILKEIYIDLDCTRNNECIIFYFRDQVSKIKYYYKGEALMYLTLHIDGGFTNIDGTRTNNDWEFNLPLSGSFSSAALQIVDSKLYATNNNRSYHRISSFTFYRN